jgi:hypothetical protein
MNELDNYRSNMLHHNDLMGPKFWAEAINIVAYIKARCLHKAVNGT